MKMSTKIAPRGVARTIANRTIPDLLDIMICNIKGQLHCIDLTITAYSGGQWFHMISE